MVAAGGAGEPSGSASKKAGTSAALGEEGDAEDEEDLTAASAADIEAAAAATLGRSTAAAAGKEIVFDAGLALARTGPVPEDASAREELFFAEMRRQQLLKKQKAEEEKSRKAVGLTADELRELEEEKRRNERQELRRGRMLTTQFTAYGSTRAVGTAAAARGRGRGRGK